MRDSAVTDFVCVCVCVCVCHKDDRDRVRSCYEWQKNNLRWSVGQIN